MTDSGWITWQQASGLTGIRVPTIEHATRVGRITRRPHKGARPSLDRESVLAWAEWYSERRIQVDQRRSRSNSPRVNVREDPPDGWLTSDHAAELLGVTVSTVRRLARIGTLTHQVLGGRLFVESESLCAVFAERTRWVSFDEAAQILGCTSGVVERLAREGWFDQRGVHRTMPSLSRESVLTAVPRWQAVVEERARRRTEREASTADGPPDDREVWLDVTTAALVLGVTRGAVQQRALKGTLPASRVGRRWWLRRDDVELASAKRAFARVNECGR